MVSVCWLRPVVFLFFFLMIRPPPRSTLFPSTPLFRSPEFRQQGRAPSGHARDALLAEPRRRRHAARRGAVSRRARSEEHTPELQSPCNLACRLLLEKKKNNKLTRAGVTYLAPPVTILS